MFSTLGAGSEAPGDLDRLIAREPAILTTSAGREFRGLLDGLQGERLGLRLATDGGEVAYSFATTEIAAIRWPGTALEVEMREHLERGFVFEALPALEALCRHRLRYFALLPPAQRDNLWLLIEHGARHGDPGTVRATLRALNHCDLSAEKHRLLLTAELHLALRSADTATTAESAARWCAAADPGGDSALGWRVLARLAYDAGDFERARWIALQPICLSGHLSNEDLDLCFALAIAASDRLGDLGHALTLHHDRLQRHIPWPAEPDFAALGRHYSPDGNHPPDRLFFPPAPPSANPRKSDPPPILGTAPLSETTPSLR